jgi:hypothetical protein
MKLYRSRKSPNKWFAYSKTTGWVMFPIEPNGWQKRQPARGIDPIDIREVPVTLAGEAGLPSEAQFTEAA